MISDQAGLIPNETIEPATTCTSAAPSIARTIPPSPPANDTPPTITAVITWSSNPLPNVLSGAP